MAPGGGQCFGSFLLQLQRGLWEIKHGQGLCRNCVLTAPRYDIFNMQAIEKTIKRACPSESLGSRVLKLHVGAYVLRIRLWGTFCCATVSSTLALWSRRVEGGRASCYALSLPIPRFQDVLYAGFPKLGVPFWGSP